jgi:hypothetical protein
MEQGTGEQQHVGQGAKRVAPALTQDVEDEHNSQRQDGDDPSPTEIEVVTTCTP